MTAPVIPISLDNASLDTELKDVFGDDFLSFTPTPFIAPAGPLNPSPAPAKSKSNVPIYVAGAVIALLLFH